MNDLHLLVEPPLGERTTHRVTKESCVVGRSSTADLVIPDRFMSRMQARLFYEQGRWCIEDLGGRNPTMLNGEALQAPRPLRPGDVVSICETRIVVQSPPDAVESGNTLFRSASALMAAREARVVELDRSAAGPDMRANWLRRMNEFHRALAGPVNLTEVLELVLERTFTELHPEEGVIFLRDKDGEYRPAATRRLPGTRGDYLSSRSLLAEVTAKGMAALVTDASLDERFAASRSIIGSGLRSLVAAPLLDIEGCRGMIALGSRAHLRQFSEEDMEELVSLAAAAALRIRNIALAEEAAQTRVLEKELALARRIQEALLPDALPTVPGWEMHGSSVPNRAVCGDIYQAQLRADGTECVLLLADVSGKGMAAALLTASLEALAAGPIEVGQPPEVICDRVSRRLHARTSPERYATGFVAVLHHETGRFCYANAGHNPALLLRRSGEVEQLPATGLPLGLLPVGDYGRQERLLGPGDAVVVYTDGFTEAADPEGEEYGLDRLVATCRAHLDGGVAALAAAVDRDVAAFAQGVPFGDDRTMLILRRLP